MMLALSLVVLVVIAPWRDTPRPTADLPSVALVVTDAVTDAFLRVTAEVRIDADGHSDYVLTADADYVEPPLDVDRPVGFLLLGSLSVKPEDCDLPSFALEDLTPHEREELGFSGTSPNGWKHVFGIYANNDESFSCTIADGLLTADAPPNHRYLDPNLRIDSAANPESQACYRIRRTGDAPVTSMDRCTVSSTPTFYSDESYGLITISDEQNRREGRLLAAGALAGTAPAMAATILDWLAVRRRWAIDRESVVGAGDQA